jgi:hypothetical protein
MHQTYFKQPQPDKAEQKREEHRRLKIAKAKIRALDGDACANPCHFNWRKMNTHRLGVLHGKVGDILSVHRLEYGSHGGGYTPENCITLCAYCHHCVQCGMEHKIIGRMSAHQCALSMLRFLKEELMPEKWRWQEVYEALENKYGGTL